MDNKWQFNSAAIVALVVGLIIGLAIGFPLGGRQATTGTPFDEADEALGRSPTGEAMMEGEGVTASEAGVANLAASGLPRQAGLPAGQAGAALPLVGEGTGTFVVRDQEAGTRVNVTDVVLDQTSWLAVRELSGGQWGNILGAKRLETGAHAGALIELLRPTRAGATYAVVLYGEDGDLAFNHKLDPVLLAAGVPLEATFTAQ